MTADRKHGNRLNYQSQGIDLVNLYSVTEMCDPICTHSVPTVQMTLVCHEMRQNILQFLLKPNYKSRIVIFEYRALRHLIKTNILFSNFFYLTILLP